MNTCTCCNEESKEELAKVRIDYPNGEDWESHELCEKCLTEVFIPCKTT